MTAIDIGVYGLGVMGSSLARNLGRHGFSVALHNHSPARIDAFMAAHGDEARFRPCPDVADFVGALERPRRILLMIKAGSPVDETIRVLRPHLEAGDVLCDGGNSHWGDTERREKELAAEGIHFVGCGVSGGESGALWGPSMMPGGSREGYARLAPCFEAIAARVGEESCCAYLGPGGVGHFVKMVHNGIEYADMQLIADAYLLLSKGLGASNDEMAELFDEWNEGPLASYLMEITARIFRTPDDDGEGRLLDRIRDRASQKGTGRWTSQAALELGTWIPAIDAAVGLRVLSGRDELRQRAAQAFEEPTAVWREDREEAVEAVHDALHGAKIVAYAQGLELIALASERAGWTVDLGRVVSLWRGGCIIRARLLETLRNACERAGSGGTILLDERLRRSVQVSLPRWRHTVATAVRMGLPLPAMSACLTWLDSLRQARLPSNLIQAQRDFFGAHTFERLDREGRFHHVWEDEGEERG